MEFSARRSCHLTLPGYTPSSFLDLGETDEDRDHTGSSPDFFGDGQRRSYLPQDRSVHVLR